MTDGQKSKARLNIASKKYVEFKFDIRDVWATRQSILYLNFAVSTVKIRNRNISSEQRSFLRD